MAMPWQGHPPLPGKPLAALDGLPAEIWTQILLVKSAEGDVFSIYDFAAIRLLCRRITLNVDDVFCKRAFTSVKFSLMPQSISIMKAIVRHPRIGSYIRELQFGPEWLSGKIIQQLESPDKDYGTAFTAHPMVEFIVHAAENPWYQVWKEYSPTYGFLVSAMRKEKMLTDHAEARCAISSAIRPLARLQSIVIETRSYGVGLRTFPHHKPRHSKGSRRVGRAAGTHILELAANSMPRCEGLDIESYVLVDHACECWLFWAVLDAIHSRCRRDLLIDLNGFWSIYHQREYSEPRTIAMILKWSEV